jgi:hypothetical protein
MLKAWIVRMNGHITNLGYLFHPEIRTFNRLLLVTACLSAIVIDHVPSISTDHELIQALGCDIHYSGALVLRAIVVDL